MLNQSDNDRLHPLTITLAVCMCSFIALIAFALVDSYMQKRQAEKPVEVIEVEPQEQPAQIAAKPEANRARKPLTRKPGRSKRALNNYGGNHLRRE